MPEELILGIETSCDDTSVALVRQDSSIVALASQDQHEIHAQYGGIYPEKAQRAHVTSLLPVCARALQLAGLNQSNAARAIKMIAVTRGPGLIGALQVGVRFAQGLGCGWSRPVIGINHLRGHISSVRLDYGECETPALILLASGGHTLLARLDAQQQITPLGQCRDDAIGEVYDKVARMLNLGFPGGPAIDRRAKKEPADFVLPRPMFNDGLEFSFAGLKSAVRRKLDAERQPITPSMVDRYCTAFVEACVDTVVNKCELALKKHRVRCLAAVGGVAASPHLRKALAAVAKRNRVRLQLCPSQYATDNAAMIALAGWDYWQNAIPANLNIDSTLSVDQW